MKLILFNLVGMIRRYKSSLILNILGLSIAFTSFVVIMIQVTYDLRYDAFHEKAGRLYRIEAKMVDEYTCHISAQLGYEMIKSSPEIEMGCWYNRINNAKFYTEQMGKENAMSSRCTQVDSAMFSMFEFQFISGDIDQINNVDNIIISEKIALKYFNTTNAVGKVLLHGESPFVIVGVFKNFPDNTFLKQLDIVRLHEEGSLSRQNANNWNFPFLVLLRDGADPHQVAKEMTERLETEKLLGDRQLQDDFMRLTLLNDVHFDSVIKYDSFEKASYATTMTLLSMAFIILLISSINFINFATALVPQRIRNINTQKVLGSTVGILRVSLLVEALIISIISFGLSLLFIYFINTTSFPSLISASINIADNALLIAILAGVAVLTGLIAGLYPAFYTTSFAPAMILKGSFGLSPRGRKLRTMLIGFQFLISFIFVSSAIFIRVQNDFMKKHDLGFNRENILNVYVPNEIAQKPSAFRDKLMQNPNIKGLTFADGNIVSTGKMGWGRGFKDNSIMFDCFPVSTEFIEVMGMRVVDGRGFIESDSLRSDGVFIFNKTAVDAFGIKVGDKIEGHEEMAEVVGIVEDFNFQTMQYPIAPICLYVMGTNPWYYPGLAYIRVSGDITAAKEHIENTLRTVAPDIKNINVYMMDDGINQLYKKEDNLALLITIFSVIAILISIIGVFGIVMFDTRYRRKEIAIRKVHGSSIAQILSMFTKYYVYMVAICFVVSVPIVFYIIGIWLESFAYRSEIHWWIFAIALTLITFITVITVIVECMKAATKNPVKSINAE